ncbi:MAG: OmpA family protein [Gemmatimonadaceae bacterium]
MLARAQEDTLAAHLTAGHAVIQEIRFVGNTDRITAASGVHIERLAKLVAARPDTFLIEGHTDGTGNPAVDQALSEKRAAVVKSRLMAAGVSGVRLYVAGFGATRPLTVANGDTASRGPPHGNARIEVVKVHREPQLSTP